MPEVVKCTLLCVPDANHALWEALFWDAFKGCAAWALRRYLLHITASHLASTTGSYVTLHHPGFHPQNENHISSKNDRNINHSHKESKVEEEVYIAILRK